MGGYHDKTSDCRKEDAKKNQKSFLLSSKTVPELLGGRKKGGEVSSGSFALLVLNSTEFREFGN